MHMRVTSIGNNTSGILSFDDGVFVRSMLRSKRSVANVSRNCYRSLSGNTVVRLAGIDIAAIYHHIQHGTDFIVCFDHIRFFSMS